jgi:hypothetical protein
MATWSFSAATPLQRRLGTTTFGLFVCFFPSFFVFPRFSFRLTFCFFFFSSAYFAPVNALASTASTHMFFIANTSTNAVIQCVFDSNACFQVAFLNSPSSCLFSFIALLSLFSTAFLFFFFVDVTTIPASLPSPRTGAVVQTADRTLIIAGSDGTTTYSEVWSAPAGTTQFSLLNNWQIRKEHCAVVVNNSHTVITMGGRSASGVDVFNDVWRFTPPGTWQLVGNAPWSTRSLFVCFVFGNQIVIGLGGSSSAVNDLWTSPATGNNPGALWTQVTADVGFPARFAASAGVHQVLLACISVLFFSFF